MSKKDRKSTEYRIHWNDEFGVSEDEAKKIAKALNVVFAGSETITEAIDHCNLEHGRETFKAFLIGRFIEEHNQKQESSRMKRLLRKMERHMDEVLDDDEEDEE